MGLIAAAIGIVELLLLQLHAIAPELEGWSQEDSTVVVLRWLNDGGDNTALQNEEDLSSSHVAFVLHLHFAFSAR